jgi:hypothetical protein
MIDRAGGAYILRLVAYTVVPKKVEHLGRSRAHPQERASMPVSAQVLAQLGYTVV